MTETTLPKNHTWLFVLLNKNTSLAGWWLKIRSIDELAAYLEQTSSRYGRAFDNYLHDSFYQNSVVGHGKYIKEANLTLAAYLRGVNRKQSMIEAMMGLSMSVAETMSRQLAIHGCLYVNASGGWNCGMGADAYQGDFCQNKNLVWPSFDQTSLRISQFPGGQHFYAYIGNVQVRDGDRLKFDTYEDAVSHARAYMTSEAKNGRP